MSDSGRLRPPLPIVLVLALVVGWFGRERFDALNAPERAVATHAQEMDLLRERLDRFTEEHKRHPTGKDVSELREALRLRDVVIDEIKARSKAVKSVLEIHARGVGLLHGTFLFERMVDGKAAPATDPDGKTWVADYLGSAFLVTRAGHLATNRHVAQPWWNNSTVAPLLESGFEPRFTHLSVTFPDHTPIDVDPRTIRVSSDDLDLATLQVDAKAVETVPVLPLHQGSLEKLRGTDVILLGYPTGLTALLARAERSAAKEILEAGTDLHEWIELLARRRLVSPIITRGALSEVFRRRLVYDAMTQSGGSGGPVFGLDGTVIGVNFAMTRDFQGSNFGVPIAHLKALLPPDERPAGPQR